MVNNLLTSLPDSTGSITLSYETKTDPDNQRLSTEWDIENLDPVYLMPKVFLGMACAGRKKHIHLTVSSSNVAEISASTARCSQHLTGKGEDHREIKGRPVWAESLQQAWLKLHCPSQQQLLLERSGYTGQGLL